MALYVEVECSSWTLHQTVQIGTVDAYNGESVTLQGEGRNRSRPVFAESVSSMGKMDPFDIRSQRRARSGSEL